MAVSALRLEQNLLTLFHFQIAMIIMWFSITRRKVRVSCGGQIPTGRILQSLPKTRIGQTVPRMESGFCIYQETRSIVLQSREDRLKRLLIQLVAGGRYHLTAKRLPTSMLKESQCHSGKLRSYLPNAERPSYFSMRLGTRMN